MIKNYFLLLLLMVSNAIIAQETLTFNGYDGAPATITATSSTVNDQITIVFEDVDLINNFYTDGRTYIHMYGGLDTPSGGFQGSPGFNDLGSQPQLTLVSTDTDANAGPNTYSLTINLAQFYTGVPDGTTVFGFNLLFQNEFGGGGNNQTADLYIDLIDAVKNSTLSITETKKTVFSAKMIDNQLLISNFNGVVTIKAYNILGKEILRIPNLEVNNTLRKTLNLPKNQISIVVIETAKSRHTLKVVL
ncbi:hypothetical protein [Olleya aquimaris]|uniref:T9SS C-terminal target domain-containing protein n=1 Tax=Olleya aquimaris TaxID=639310 RepID=A0A327R7V6_9FLAO|nr:hypothetical protein [Olleya aquimaris]RAJ12946.1 hypothetical protein LY08_02228 [Olleya aquimaris]